MSKVQRGHATPGPMPGRKPGGSAGGLPSFASAIGLACLAAMALVILIPSRMPGLVPAEDW